MFTSALALSLTSSSQLLADLMEAVDESMVRNINVGFSVRYWAKQRSVVSNSVEILNKFSCLCAGLNLGSA